MAVGVALGRDLLEDHFFDGAAVLEDPLAVGLLQRQHLGVGSTY